MYLLDTDVIWATRGHNSPESDEPLFQWVADQLPSTLFASAISMIEFENGTRLLERKDRAAASSIRNWIETRLRPAFEGRVIPVDAAIIRRWSQLGYSDFRDGMLAATAIEHGLTIATGTPKNFRVGKVKTLNPRSYAPEAEELDWRRASRSAPIWLKSLFVRA